MNVCPRSVVVGDTYRSQTETRDPFDELVDVEYSGTATTDEIAGATEGSLKQFAPETNTAHDPDKND